MTNQSTKAAAKALMQSMSPDTLALNADALGALLQPGTQDAPAAPSEPTDGSPLAARFEHLWRTWGGPELQHEYRFHPARRWRLDYYHAPTRTGIELEGGLYSGGRHSRATGYLADIDKYNAAAMAGIAVLRLGTGQVDSERVKEIIDYIARKAAQP